MAGGNFFARLFGINNANSENSKEERMSSNVENNTTENTTATLQDVLNFVTELQSYYYNDICKMQSDLLVQTTLTPDRENFINKKIRQDKVALSQIDAILEEVKNHEREYQSVWRKSIYSFYDEIEKAKLSTVQKQVFSILLRLYTINTKQELESIILNKLEKYKADWNITQEMQFPKNFNAILVDEADGIEKYRLGPFCKRVYASIQDKTLSARQLDQIRALTVKFENSITTENIWVYVSSCTRLQVNRLRRTCFIDNEWEYTSETEKTLSLDIVKMQDMEQYLKGVLQIVLAKKTYAVISIVVPTEKMLGVIGKTIQEDGKVEICKKYRFILKERSEAYGDNLLTVRIDRRNIPEELQFLSYSKFRRLYF